MKLKEAMKLAKATGKRVKVTEKTDISVKVNLNMRIDLETLNSLKKDAEKKGLPYQTLINSILKQHADQPDLTERVEKIERQLKHG